MDYRLDGSRDRVPRVDIHQRLRAHGRGVKQPGEEETIRRPTAMDGPDKTALRLEKEEKKTTAIFECAEVHGRRVRRQRTPRVCYKTTLSIWVLIGGREGKKKTTATATTATTTKTTRQKGDYKTE